MSVVLVRSLAMLIGVVPVVYLAAREVRLGVALDDGWWWVAGAFAVSFLADVLALLLPTWLTALVSLGYPILQAGIIAAVLLPKSMARLFMVGLLLAGLAAVAIEGTATVDVLLRTVAWLGVCGLVWGRYAMGRLRTVLLYGFGLLWAVWCLHAAFLIVPTWGLYQGVRLAVALGFCWAAKEAQTGLLLVGQRRPG